MYEENQIFLWDKLSAADAFLGWGILFNTALEKQILQDGNMQSSDIRSSDMQSDDTQSNHMQSDDMRANATQTDDVQTSDMRDENMEISEKNGAEEGKTTAEKNPGTAHGQRVSQL